MTVRVLDFTDPACPVAFSAEPVRRRLQWLFGDQLAWEPVMVVLNDGSRPGGGPPSERMAASRRRLHAQHGMPVDPHARTAASGSLEAARLVVAARLHAPGHEEPLLRALRVRAMAGGDLDRAAVEEVGARAPEAVAGMDDEAVGERLAADMAAARAVSPAGLALGHRLGAGGARYSTPSYRYVAGDRTFELVGIHPVEAHEAVLANLAPELERRAGPGDAGAVLDWAGTPLATAEVAAVMRASMDEARGQLDAVARFAPAGLDGYWRR